MDQQNRTSVHRSSASKKPLHILSGHSFSMVSHSETMAPAVFNIKNQNMKEENLIGAYRAGTVKSFNPERGYGFICDNITHESYFVYRACLRDLVCTNDKVYFEIEKTAGGLIATNVRMILLQSGSHEA